MSYASFHPFWGVLHLDSPLRHPIFLLVFPRGEEYTTESHRRVQIHLFGFQILHSLYHYEETQFNSKGLTYQSQRRPILSVLGCHRRGSSGTPTGVVGDTGRYCTWRSSCVFVGHRTEGGNVLHWFNGLKRIFILVWHKRITIFFYHSKVFLPFHVQKTI